jgi:hypothetical protein
MEVPMYLSDYEIQVIIAIVVFILGLVSWSRAVEKRNEEERHQSEVWNAYLAGREKGRH